MPTTERRTTVPRFEVLYRLGKRRYCGDLIFQGGKPILVISWKTLAWKRVPYIAFALEPEKLRTAAGSPGQYIYEGDLDSPGK